MIRQCDKCAWTFVKTHTNQCPQCGSTTHEHDELNQYSWRVHKRKQYENVLDQVEENPSCCWTAKHTKGNHHDQDCPNYVIK